MRRLDGGEPSNGEAYPELTARLIDGFLPLFFFIFDFLDFFGMSYRMMSDYRVEMVNDGMQEFYVYFHGPNESILLEPFLCFILFFEVFFSFSFSPLIWVVDVLTLEGKSVLIFFFF